MKELVYVKEMGVEKVGVTNSRLIAERFKKRHDHVLRDIETLITQLPEFSCLNFGLSKYVDSQGKTQKQYELTEEEAMLLVMGFTGEKALQVKVSFINAFKAMRDVLRGMASSRLDVMGHIQAAFKQTSKGSILDTAISPSASVKPQLLSFKETCKEMGKFYCEGRTRYELENPVRLYIFSTSKDHCKVGVSRFVNKRLRTLERSGGFKIIAFSIFKCQDARGLETWLHRMFDSKRVSGEYFNVTLDEIKATLFKYKADHITEI